MLPRVLIWLAATALLARSRAAVARAPRKLRGGIPLASLGLVLAACAPVLTAAPVASAQADTVPPPTPPVAQATASHGAPATPQVPDPSAEVEVGNASWYGPHFAGRLTSDGEVFDPSKLTAAHRTLPFGTLVRVTNLVNGESVVVRINDRGPFKPNRIIDLSRAAAEAIGMKNMGVAKVKLQPLALPDGVVRVGVDDRLQGYQVESRFHRVGQLLVLSRRSGADAVVVRVVGNEVPPGSGADVLVGHDLFAKLGEQAHVAER
ncbi:MAG: septal ring lytic transglycosylase RlpA family protein [Deinococcales bacterium]